MNLPQPPEGILDPQIPWHSPMPKSPGLWGTLKARLTGRANEYGNYSSYVNLTQADADRLIENMKKDPRGYPQLDQTSGSPAQMMERQRIYQEWLVEEYLENPFRQEVNEKIDAKTSHVLDRVFPQAHEEIQEAETKEEVSEVLQEKIDILEDIQEKIAPPPTEYKIPDPWEGSYTTPKPQATTKKTKKKGRPKGSKNKKPKKKEKVEQPPQSPESKRQRVVNMVGGKILSTAKNFAKTVLKPSGPSGSGGTAHYGASAGGGSTPSAAGEGPSLFGIGSWLGKKVTDAFQDAKVERARALEAQSNGAEVPAEMLEPGYFIRKSLGYQFGGRAFDTTFGAFIENMPSKQSSKKAGFGDQFDYGENDPNKKKKKKDVPGELASGFRAVSKSLKNVSSKLSQNINLLGSLIGETTKVADSLDKILLALSGLSDAETQNMIEDEMQASSGGDVNIGDINIGMGGGNNNGINALDILGGVDDAFDIANLRKGKKGLGNQNRTYRRMRQGGMPSMKSTPRMGAPKGRFGMLMNLASMAGRTKLSGGAAIGGRGVPVMVGEAGPELVVQSGVQKLAEGGVTQGAGSNVIASLGGTTDLMKRVQPFANVMEMPFKVIGSQISSVLSALVSAAGPFSGVIARMFSPLLGGLATIFGLNQGAFAAELDSAAMTEKEGAKTLSKFFRSFFKLFGINMGGDDEDDDNSNPENFDIKDGPVYEKGASIAKILQSRLGIKDYQAAAIVGNMIQESGLQPDVLEGSKKGTLQDAMNKGAGYSYPQWTSANRQDGFAKYMESKGHDWKTKPATDDLALGYVIEEFPTYDSGNVFKNSKDIASASNWVLKNYEGPAVQDAREKQERVNDSASVLAKMARGGSAPTVSNFSEKVHGVFEINGPDTGYKVPKEYTGGQSVIGHGLEWLIKLQNKFIILPGVNREYNVYKDPAKAFNRYEEIGREGGVQVAGFVDFVDRIIFGPPHKGPSNVRYQSGPKDAIEAIGGKYYAPYGPDSSFKPVRGASLPSGTVTPVKFESGETVASVAILNNNVIHQQQVPVYIPVPVPGPTQYVHANPYQTAKTMQFVDFARNLS